MIEKALLARMGDRDIVYDSLNKLHPDLALPFLRLKKATDSYYNYTRFFKISFYQFCGDSLGRQLLTGAEDSVGLTNSFLKTFKPILEFYPKLLDVSKALQPFCNDSLKQARFYDLDPGVSETIFYGKYFNNLPPVAVITIINSFDYKVEELEGRVLYPYLNPKQ